MKDNSERNFLNVKLVGEDGDLPCHPTKSNSIIKTKLNGFQVGYNAIWYEWEFAIVFPDHEKAKYFIEHFKPDMHDYREGMLGDDYYVHIIHFKYPRVDTLYADQIRVTKDESTEKNYIKDKIFEICWSDWDEVRTQLFYHPNKTHESFKLDCELMMRKYGDEYIDSQDNETYVHMGDLLFYICDKMGELGYEKLQPKTSHYFGGTLLTGEYDDDYDAWSKKVGNRLVDKITKINSKIHNNYYNSVEGVTPDEICPDNE